jgi:Tol biopolymer transport system component
MEPFKMRHREISYLLVVAVMLAGARLPAQNPPPGDRRIAYIERVTKPDKTSEHWLHEIKEDGSSLKKVLLLDSHNTYKGISFSPDGSHIYYCPTIPKSPLSEILCMHRDGTGERQLTDAPGYYSNIVWSPDGRRIAYEQLAKQYGDRSPNICVVGIDGAGLKRQIPTKGFNVWAWWSPDGAKLAYTYREDQSPTAQILIVDVNRNDPPRKVCDMLTGYMQWSPDGRHLAIENWNVKQETAVVDVERPGAIKRVPGKDPHWSSDGSKIAVMQNECNLLIFDVESGDIRRLTNDPHKKASLIYAAWSPDGSQIAYAVEDNLELIHADGTGQKRITNFPKHSRVTYMRGSSDGKKVLFYASVARDLKNAPQHVLDDDEAMEQYLSEDKNNLYVVDASSGRIVRLTQKTTHDTNKIILVYTWLQNQPKSGK